MIVNKLLKILKKSVLKSPRYIVCINDPVIHKAMYMTDDEWIKYAELYVMNHRNSVNFKILSIDNDGIKIEKL